MIAESLGDLVRAQSKETFAHLREQYPDDEDYNTHVEAYLLQQKDLLLLATAGITTGLGLDVDTAIDVAVNALTHNWLQAALATATITWEIYALTHEDVIEQTREAIIDFVAEKTGFSKETVAKTFDGLTAGAGLVRPVKGGIDALKKGAKEVGKAAFKEGAKKGAKDHVGHHQPIKKPDTLQAFPDAVEAKRKTPVQGGGGLRPRWKDKKHIYEWDKQHGTIEKYSKNGDHLGEFDHITGKKLKPADPKRRVEK